MNKIRALEREQETDDFAERERIPNVLPKLRRVSAEKRAVGRRARIAGMMARASSARRRVVVRAWRSRRAIWSRKWLARREEGGGGVGVARVAVDMKIFSDEAPAGAMKMGWKFWRDFGDGDRSTG